MASTLEDIDRRVAALELAPSRTGDALARLERKVDGVTTQVDALHRVTAEMIEESEQRLEAKIVESEQRMGARVTAVELHLGERIDRIDARIGATETRFVDLLNERFDAVMVALDRFQNPPKS
jgi:hypothetical protein